MQIVEINTGNYGSTGKIMIGICELAKRNAINCTVSYPDSRMNQSKRNEDDIIIGTRLERNIHRYISEVFNCDGCLSYFATKRLIKKIKKLNCDMVHLHNLHGWYINLPLLFRFFKKSNIRVVWTLHDCWSFTGRCPYFDIEKCDKWKTGCHDCSYPKYFYPSTKTDTTKTMWKRKKKWFTGVKNMTIVTPSKWLADLVGQSFLKDYPVKVINNGIDLSVFKPTQSEFRKKYHCEDKHIILGVAFGWDKRKGFDVFVDLASRLSKEYIIVLVGTAENTEKQLPDNVISIRRTQNQRELAEIYSVADVFVNPTREENYPTVNMESIACGTPVVTFRTGGSPEMIDDTCSSVVDCDDNAALFSEIIRICETKPYSMQACLQKAKCYDMNDKFKEYIKLYEDCAYSSHLPL